MRIKELKEIFKKQDRLDEIVIEVYGRCEGLIQAYTFQDLIELLIEESRKVKKTCQIRISENIFRMGCGTSWYFPEEEKCWRCGGPLTLTEKENDA